jgi:hypothetical protein
MKVYLINAETDETIQTFEDVIGWSVNFVEYNNGGYGAKMYCNENEYFTDKEVVVEELGEDYERIN